VRDVLGNDPSGFEGDNLPVESVSWNDTQEFIRKLNDKEGVTKYRLPSEAEWEYAARAGTATRYSFGDNESELGEYEWYNGNSGSETHEVDRKNPIHGAYTIYTVMSGNGFRIPGTKTIKARQLMEVHGKEMTPTVSFGAAGGTTRPGTSVRRIATRTMRTTAAIFSDFVS